MKFQKLYENDVLRKGDVWLRDDIDNIPVGHQRQLYIPMNSKSLILFTRKDGTQVIKFSGGALYSGVCSGERIITSPWKNTDSSLIRMVARKEKK